MPSRVSTSIISRLLIVLLALAPAVMGQMTRGFISGTVQDATGAVIPGVKVFIVERSTNAQRSSETNESGVYRFVAVEPGTYSVEFTKEGFEVRRLGSVRVDANQEVTVNQTLAVGAVGTTVEVIEAPPGVELSKSTATTGQTLDQNTISKIPLTGNRDVTRLVLLAPTVTRAPGSNEFSAGGQRARNNNFMIDGVDNNDPSVTLPNQRVVPEAIEQFQVLTNAYSAEFGRNSGAQVLVTTRRGSNRMHGEVYDYYRANWLEPVSLLNKRAGLTSTPRFVQNQAGASIGGPIVRDRLFFHGFMDVNRRRAAADARSATAITIPTPTGYAALAGIPLGAGQTQASRQAALDSLKFLPEVHGLIPRFDNVRNLSVNGVPVEVGTARIPLSNPHNYSLIQPRVDYHATDRDMLTYRAQIDKREDPDVISNLGFGNRWSGDQTIMGQNHMLSHTRSFTPTFTNEARFGYTRRNLNFPERDPISPTVGITGAFTIGGANNFPQGRISNTFQWQNISTWLYGRHSLKFGGDIRRNRLFNRSGFNSKGSWTFTSLEDFVNSRPFSLLQAVNEASFDARQNNLFFFVQDDFKATRDLTLNFGLRYEYSDVPFGFFGATDPQSLSAGVPGLVRPDKNNWAPRFGFAYSPSDPGSGLLGSLLGKGRTVVRGGYGVTYDVLFFNIATVTASNFPRVVTDEKFGADLVNVYPALLPKQATAPPFNPLATWANAPEDSQAPTSHFWSLSVQRQFASDFIGEIGYTGNRSYHGLRQGQLNTALLTSQQAQTVLAGGAIPTVQQRRLNSAWGSRVTIESTAKANYNAVFARLDKRFAGGLRFGGSYTFSKTMSDNDESLAVADIVNSSPPVPQDYLNYRNEWSRSAFDRPHRFVVHYNYTIPWFKSGPAANAVLRHAFGGWEIGGFNEYQSGQAFTIRTGVDSSGTGDARAHRPNYNPGGIMTADPVSGDFRTFTIPLNGTGIVTTPLTPSGIPLANSMFGGGNLGRNTFRGPSFMNWNFNVSKNFSLTERWRLQVRSDWVNFLNQRNFGNPVSTMNSPAFGTNTTDPGGRTGLLALKLMW
jgi:hypothetical protein